MKIAIYGLGLIGGSLGRAILKKTQHTVLGYDTDKDTMLKAKLLRAIDEEITEDNISQADIVVFALTPAAAVSQMQRVVPLLKKGAIVTDCCGVKRDIVPQMRTLSTQYPVAFVSAHPMAGREFSGISHSTAGLFEHAYIVLTSVAAPLSALATVKQLYIDVGAEGVVVSSAENHDRLIAYTSQLAHVVSSAYIKNPLYVYHKGFSAGSFRDMTRVAKLNPDMWTELFLSNKDFLTDAIDDLILHLSEYRTAIAADDAETLRELLAQGVAFKENAERIRREKEQK